MLTNFRRFLLIAALLLISTERPPHAVTEAAFDANGQETEGAPLVVHFAYSGVMVDAPHDGRWVRFFSPFSHSRNGDLARWNGQYWGSPDGAFLCGDCDRWSIE